MELSLYCTNPSKWGYAVEYEAVIYGQPVLFGNAANYVTFGYW